MASVKGQQLYWIDKLKKMNIDRQAHSKFGLSLISIFISLFFYSCFVDTKPSSIKITTNRDTIALNDTLKANLYLDNYDQILPEFFIVNKGDTARIPFDDSTKCAIFQAVGRQVGKLTYNGYVEYFDKFKVSKKENFVIAFFVK